MQWCGWLGVYFWRGLVYYIFEEWNDVDPLGSQWENVPGIIIWCQGHAEWERSDPEWSRITPEWKGVDNKSRETTLASACALCLDLLLHMWLHISGGWNCCQECRRRVVYRLIGVEMDIKDVNDFNLWTKELGCNYWNTYTKSRIRGVQVTSLHCDPIGVDNRSLGVKN